MVKKLHELYGDEIKDGPEKRFIKKHTVKVSDPSGYATANKNNTETTVKDKHMRTPDGAYESEEIEDDSMLDEGLLSRAQYYLRKYSGKQRRDIVAKTDRREKVYNKAATWAVDRGYPARVQTFRNISTKNLRRGMAVSGSDKKMAYKYRRNYLSGKGQDMNKMESFDLNEISNEKRDDYLKKVSSKFYEPTGVSLRQIKHARSRAQRANKEAHKKITSSKMESFVEENYDRFMEKYGPEQGKVILERTLSNLDKQGYFEDLQEASSHEIFERYVGRSLEAAQNIITQLKVHQKDNERKEEDSEKPSNGNYISGGPYVDTYEIKEVAGQLEGIMDRLSGSTERILKNNGKDKS